MRADVNATLMILSIAKNERTPQNLQSNRREMTTITDQDRELYGPSRQPAGEREQRTLCPRVRAAGRSPQHVARYIRPERMISGASAIGR
jgi:hypothetical protein